MPAGCTSGSWCRTGRRPAGESAAHESIGLQPSFVGHWQMPAVGFYTRVRHGRNGFAHGPNAECVIRHARRAGAIRMAKMPRCSVCGSVPGYPRSAPRGRCWCPRGRAASIRRRRSRPPPQLDGAPVRSVRTSGFRQRRASVQNQAGRPWRIGSGPSSAGASSSGSGRSTNTPSAAVTRQTAAPTAKARCSPDMKAS